MGQNTGAGTFISVDIVQLQLVVTWVRGEVPIYSKFYVSSCPILRTLLYSLKGLLTQAITSSTD